MFLNPGSYAVLDRSYIFDLGDRKLNAKSNKMLDWCALPKKCMMFTYKGFRLAAFESSGFCGCTIKQMNDVHFPNKPIFDQYELYDIGDPVPKGKFLTESGIHIIAPMEFIKLHCNDYVKWLFDCKYYYGNILMTFNVKKRSIIEFDDYSVRIGNEFTFVPKRSFDIQLFNFDYPIIMKYSISTISQVYYQNFIANNNIMSKIDIFRQLNQLQKAANETFLKSLKCNDASADPMYKSEEYDRRMVMTALDIIQTQYDTAMHKPDDYRFWLD
jgi:hypothetical protein